VVVGLVDEELSEANRKAIADLDVRKGDVVEGFVDGEAPKRPASARNWYLSIWQQTPGRTVVLRVRGRGDLRLVVDQGMDERKPLFSAFFTLKHWVGWSPQGPYEVSDARIEEQLGWHKNTGNAAAPTAFAPLAQYRKDYHRPGILAALVAKGNLPDALKALETDID